MVGNLGGQLTTTYKPAQGQVMVWVMGWESSETTTTTYVTKQLNLIGDGVDPLGWLTNKNTTKKGPYVTYAQSRRCWCRPWWPIPVNLPCLACCGTSSRPALKDVVLPNYVEGSGKQELRADPNGPIYIPGLGRFSVVTVGGQQRVPTSSSPTASTTPASSCATTGRIPAAAAGCARPPP